GADADLTARVASILGSQNQANGLPSSIVSPSTRLLPPGPPLDPGAPGPLDVTMQNYDLGNQVFQPAQFGATQKVELTARVFSPTVLDGQRPLLIFLHGNHQATYNPTTLQTQFVWPPAAGFVPLPNHQGYDYLGQNLASHGYIVVSISADGVNVLG